MWEEYIEKKNHLFFASDPRAFATEAEKILRDVASQYPNASAERKTAIEYIVAELAKDSMSALPAWTLRQDGSRIDESLSCFYHHLLELLSKWGKHELRAQAEADVYSIANSNLRRITRLTDRALLNNRIGNDAAWGLSYAMRRGACFSTTNPVMVNGAKNNFPELWTPVRDRLRRDNPDASVDHLVTLFTIEVVYRNCIEYLPLFEATGGELGHVSMQVNPHNADNGPAMQEEAEFMYTSLEKRLGRKPNIMFKLPAVAASLEPARNLVKQGIRLNVTSNCSLSQHTAFAPIVEQGRFYSYMVMINGRFDEPVAEELKTAGIADADLVSRHASNAVIKKSYVLHKQRNYRKSIILPASMRGPWHVASSLTSGEFPIHISCFPDKAIEYDQTLERIEPGIDIPTPPDVLDVLSKSDIFRKAYDEKGLQPEEFITFPPIVAMMIQFRKCYDDTAAFMRG